MQQKVLVVARATIAGEPVLEAAKVPEFKLKVGEPLSVKFLYRFEESSQERESWKFRLKSKLGPSNPPPAEAAWKDRRVLHDEVWGFVEHTYVALPAGSHAGEFEVEALYGRGKWGDKAEQTKRAATKGTFKVKVG